MMVLTLQSGYVVTNVTNGFIDCVQALMMNSGHFYKQLNLSGYAHIAKNSTTFEILANNFS